MALTKHQLKFNSAVGKCDEVKSFLATDGGGLLTSTTAGGKEALDVNIAASDISISVAESDVYAEDSAHTSGDDGAFMLAVRRDARAVGSDADGDYSSLNVNAVGELWVKDADVLAQLQSGVVISDGGGSITVDGSVDAVQSGTWTVQLSDGVDALDINADGSINAIVSATDLDIRDLNSATDSVSAVQSGAWSVDIGNEPSVNLQDGLGNDIESLNGHLKVVDCVDTVSYSAPALTAAAAATAVSAVSGQSFMEIQNLGDEPLYMVGAGATAASPGLLIPCGGTWSGKVCGSVNLFSLNGHAAGEVQVAQYAIS